MALLPRYVGRRLASGRPGRRHRFRGIAIFGLYIAGGWLLPGRKRVVPYSIQTAQTAETGIVSTGFDRPV